jgi:hypothetical protein
VPPRHNRQNSQGVQEAALESLIAAEHPDGQVQLTVLNTPEQRIGTVFDELYLHPWSSAPICRQHLGKCALDELRWRADPEYPAFPTTECSGAPLKGIDIGKNSSSPPQ